MFSVPSSLFPVFRRVFPLFLLFLFLPGCAGYQLAADQPGILGNGSKTLKVKGVDYPTLHPWLPFAIRSQLRDEINARSLASWVDSGPADYEIQIKVISFRSLEWVRSKYDQTLLYDTSMVIEAIIYQGETNKEFWRSGLITYGDRLELPDEKHAANNIITQIIRQLADKMRTAF